MRMKRMKYLGKNSSKTRIMIMKITILINSKEIIFIKMKKKKICKMNIICNKFIPNNKKSKNYSSKDNSNCNNPHNNKKKRNINKMITMSLYKNNNNSIIQMNKKIKISIMNSKMKN